MTFSVSLHRILIRDLVWLPCLFGLFFFFLKIFSFFFGSATLQQSLLIPAILFQSLISKGLISYLFLLILLNFFFLKKINFNPPYLFILKNLNNSLRKEGKNNCLIMTQGKGISVCSFFASSQSHLQNSLSSIQQKFRYNSSTALLLGPPQSYYFFVFFFIIF